MNIRLEITHTHYRRARCKQQHSMVKNFEKFLLFNFSLGFLDDF